MVVLRSLGVIACCIALVLGLAYAVGGARPQLAGMPLLVFLAVVAMWVQWLAFIPSYFFQTEHYYDLTGSVTYLVVIGLALLFGAESPVDNRVWLVSGLIGLWALRLGGFLFWRVKQVGKDGRFDVIKNRWPRFLMTWTLQGVWVFVTLLAALVAITTDHHVPLGWTAAVGVMMWVVGFTLETAADIQKSLFNRVPENEAHFINVGLWRWSRHPNYFGEMLLWAGIALIAVPVFQGLEWLALISPVFVVVLLMRISGIPLLEKRADRKWGASMEYQVYKKETPLLLPRPPRN